MIKSFNVSKRSKQQPKQSAIKLDVSAPGHPQRKIKCPSCGQKRYVRYWDTERLEYLPEQFGKCDRESSCGYHTQPWEWIKDNRPNNTSMQPKPYQPAGKSQSLFKEPKQVPKDTVSRTLAAYDENNFVLYLRTLFTDDQVQQLCAEYFVGTAKDGGTIFWQMDAFMRVRTGKLFMYDAATGKRSGDVKHLFMVHEGYEPCIFGEHLLYTTSGNTNKMPIAIVESEKTAIIARAYMPYLGGRRVLWMASGAVYGLTDEKILTLAGKEVILVPDFSFHARAIWGQVPMRKLTCNVDGKQTTKIHQDGVLVEDYVSVAMRLQRVHCKVSFFDAAPEVNDASDIADLLVLSKAPQLPTEPNYDDFQLPSPHNAAQQHTAQANSEENNKAVEIFTPKDIGFRIAFNADMRPAIACDNAQATEYLKELFDKSAPLTRLVKELDICSGILTTDNDAEKK